MKMSGDSSTNNLCNPQHLTVGFVIGRSALQEFVC